MRVSLCGLSVAGQAFLPIRGKAGDYYRSWPNLSKTSKRGALVRKNIKYRVELRNLQKIADLLRQVQQFQIAALVLHRGEPAHQLANPRTVDVIDIAKVQENFRLLIAE